MTNEEIRNLGINAFYNGDNRLTKVVEDYNQSHPEAILTKENFNNIDDKTLTQLVKKSGISTKKLGFNQSLVSIINRCNPKYIQDLGITLDPRKYKSSPEFWNF